MNTSQFSSAAANEQRGARHHALVAAVLAALLLLVPESLFAGDEAKGAAQLTTQSTRKKAQTALPTKKSQESCCLEKVTITGTLIPQAKQPKAAFRDSFAPVAVMDREAIERSGAATTAEVFKRFPGVATRR